MVLSLRGEVLEQPQGNLLSFRVASASPTRPRVGDYH